MDKILLVSLGRDQRKAPKGRKDYRRGYHPRYWIPKCTEALKGRKMVFRAFSTPIGWVRFNGGCSLRSHHPRLWS